MRSGWTACAGGTADIAQISTLAKSRSVAETTVERAREELLKLAGREVAPKSGASIERVPGSTKGRHLGTA